MLLFLLLLVLAFCSRFIGERAERARHSQVCSIEIHYIGKNINSASKVANWIIVDIFKYLY